MKPKRLTTVPLVQQPDAIEPLVQQPTADTLAGLAAQARFDRLPSLAAAQAALALWRDCQAALAGAQRCRAHYDEPLKNLRQAKEWPAPFTEFLHNVVPGKDAGEREMRFLDYLEDKARRSPRLHGTDPKAAKRELLGEFKATSFSREGWRSTAIEFIAFWKRYKAELKSQAGKQGAAAKAAKRVAEK